ncbi:MAG: gamma-glutamylcyclotransferase family protein [Allomuricauda sp.]
MDHLFTYGTLQDLQVQEYVFGRLLHGQIDSLPGFKRLENAVYGKYALVVYTDNAEDVVPGKVYEVSEADLRKADVYETNAYKREKFRLQSGIYAWVYLKNSK